MRVKLYKDITTENIFTLSEAKAEYSKANDCELPIDGYTMESIIFENLACVGGNIEVISNNDEVLAWCNDYAEEMEAERYLSNTEIEYSIKECYEGIINADEYILQPIRDNLYGNRKLLDRLNKLLKEVK